MEIIITKLSSSTKGYCHLTIEANGWNRVEILVQFHHVERCGFPGPVQSDHDDVEELASTLQWEGVQESVGVFSCHLECTEETRQGSQYLLWMRPRLGNS